MGKLMDAINYRVSEVYHEKFEQEESAMKTFSFKMFESDFEKLSNLAMYLQMNKSECIRFILSNAVDDIIEQQGLKFEEITDPEEIAKLSQKFGFKEVTNG